MSDTNPNQTPELTDFAKAEAAVKFTDISIKSDGTPAGTKVLINGKEIADLSRLCVSFYPGQYGWFNLEFYTMDSKYEPGTLAQEIRHILRPPKQDRADAAIERATASDPVTVIEPTNPAVNHNRSVMSQI